MKFNIVSVVISVILCAASAQADELKLGLVDMQRALQTVHVGKKAKTQLEKEFNTKKKELQIEESAIRKSGEEFKKQSLVLSDEARAKKQGELQERIIKFQELTAKSQAEIQQRERDLTSPIIEKLRLIISELAKKKQLSVVFEKSENTILFTEQKHDLTDEVIKLFDQQTKS